MTIQCTTSSGQEKRGDRIHLPIVRDEGCQRNLELLSNSSNLNLHFKVSKRLQIDLKINYSWLCLAINLWMISGAHTQLGLHSYRQFKPKKNDKIKSLPNTMDQKTSCRHYHFSKDCNNILRCKGYFYHNEVCILGEPINHN